MADTADEIAYINHDLDDGLGSGLLAPERLEEVALWRETRRAVREQLGGAPERVLRAQVVVALINRLVTDLIEAVAKRVDARGLASVDAVRACPERLVQFSPELEKPKRELKKFLYDELYQHPQVLAMNERAVRNPRRALRRLSERSGTAARPRARAHRRPTARPARSPTTSRA